MNENRLAENLMYYRKKKGLSQEKIAEYLEISRQAVTKWETNASKPNSDNLIKSQPYGLTTGSAGGLDEPLRGIFRYRL